MLKLEDKEKKNLPDETSKADEPLNVNPDTSGNPTSTDSKPTEPSKDTQPKDENIQKAIQEHAELRKKAEEARAKAEEEATKAKEEAEKARQEAKLAKEEADKARVEIRKDKAEMQIKDRIKNSNLPNAMKERALKDPVRWLIANAEQVSEKPTWDEVDSLIGSELDGLVETYEREFGVRTSPKHTFIDVDNAPTIVTPSKTLSRLDISKMTPYEIASLPPETLAELKRAGSKVEI